mgnify:CR=1 FL=1
MNRRYKIKNFLNEDVEQVDEIFWGKKRKSKYHDDDYVETDDKEVYADDLISFDKNRIKKITSAISAYVSKYTTNSKDKEDTVELIFEPTIRSSLEKVKKQLSKLKNVLKIKSIQVLHSLVIITLKNQHKYS